MNSNSSSKRLSTTSAGRITYFRWEVVAPVLIIFFALCAYSNSFAAPFLFDDHLNIVSNPYIRNLWPLWDAMSRPFWFNQADVYTILRTRPFTSLTFALNYAFGGLDVWGYHAVNVMIHIMAGLVLFGVVRRTFLLPRLKTRYQQTASSLACVISLIWTVHPIQTESITYLFQRCESLMGLFYLATLYFFIRWLTSRRGIWAACSIIFCAAGMASKEIMVTAPILMLLYHRIFAGNSFKVIYRNDRWFYLGLASTWVILAALIYQRLPVQGSTSELYTSSSNPYLEYILTQPAVILRYIKLALCPDSLTFYYARPFIFHDFDISGSFFLVIMLAMITFWMLRFRPALGYLGAWFFLILAPTSSVRSLNMIAAEHRMYLPLAAVVCFAVMVVYGVMNRLKRRVDPIKNLISLSGFLIATLTVIILSVLTFERNEVYRSAISIWQDSVSKQPNDDILRYNLGRALFVEGALEVAVEQYLIALSIDARADKPFTAMKHNNVAMAFMRLGRIDEAVEHLVEASKIDPSSRIVKENLERALILKKNRVY